jgi:phosphoadenosine phosphosulfate reductase
MTETGDSVVNIFIVTQSTLADLLSGREDLVARSTALEAFSAEELIRAAIDVHGDRAIVSTAFGAAGLCVLDMAQRAKRDVRAYYIDTGFSFPETTALTERWVGDRQLNLQKVLPVLSPDEQAKAHGDALWDRDPDRCCAMRKVEPNERALAGSTLWIAALRRDEASTRKSTAMLSEVTLGSGQKILKLCPIVGWSTKDVWRYIAAHELPYNELHDRGYPSIGCTHCTRPVTEGEDERSGRWSGKDKVECGLHLPKVN